MTVLIHGENINLSQNKLIELKSNFQGVVQAFPAKELTPVLLRENLASQTLFSEKKLLVIENPTENKNLFDDLQLSSDVDLILYQDDKLTQAQVLSLQKKLLGLKVEEFKIDPVVFKFLESLSPKNQKVMIPLWKEYIKSEQPEIALVMLARQIRLLLGDDDFEKLAPWQKQRITDQRKKFTEEELISFHSKLLDADYKTKTGQTLLDLRTSLELLLLSL